jgi:ribosome-dependent ATPase
MDALVIAEQLTHSYGKTQALDGISLSLDAGKSVAFIGPDGVGKSTLLGLIAGAKRMQEGTLTIFGGDVRKKSMQRELQQRVAYMPQGLGKNLYPDLSIRENLEFFARLYEQDKAERSARIHHLTAATGLEPFLDRPVGKLSGGMKQKLGLCCALIHDPELLILDEPTTGIDPLSRRQFWALIDDIRAQQKNLTVVVATSYMEEAEQFDSVIMMDDGKIIAQGTAETLKQQSETDDLEKAFIAFLPEEKRRDHIVPNAKHRDLSGHPTAIEAKGLTKRFGDFTAVDHVDFTIPTGEIYGFLGSNGCGKTTTMKMLTGLLPVSEGESSMLGKTLVAGDIANRRRIGYMSQAFSLYSELTVHQNLTLHANLYGLDQKKAAARFEWIYRQFDLTEYKNANSGALPLGVRQRLSLAVAVIHEPEILILDEPTSGVDPIARDNFWALLIELAHKQNVTIFISTHFMNEATRCDRISLMHAGKVIATGTPEELRESKRAATLDEAFVIYLEEAQGDGEQVDVPQTSLHAVDMAAKTPARPRLFSMQRMMAYLWREMLEMRRDPIRLSIATLGMALLMMVFGFGITLDVDSLRYAVLDRDQSPESRTYIENFAGSPYFKAQSPLHSHDELLARMRDGSVSLALEIPTDFGKDLRRGTRTEIAATIDGAMPFRAETIGGYTQAIHRRFLKDQRLLPGPPLVIESRYRYNQSFESVNAMVPSVMGLLLVFIPAILATLAVVREKEMGSIANLYVTPISRVEFILGKQIPYILFSMVGFGIMLLLAIFVFGVPLKGSLLGLTLGALAYITATTGLGLLVSSFTSSQIAALFGTAILTMMPATQFSGLLRPVATLEGSAYWIGTLYPTTYFLKTGVGAFTKGLDFMALLPFLVNLGWFVPVLLILNTLTLRKQET